MVGRWMRSSTTRIGCAEEGRSEERRAWRGERGRAKLRIVA
jgi:hypothetical protein